MNSSKPKPQANRASLTEGPIAKTLFLFSLPILLGNVLQSLNGSINSIWIGQYLGEQALAATSNANILMFLLISAIFGIAMAAVILVGQNLGAKKIDEAKKVVGTSTVFFAVLSVIVGGIGVLFSEAILGWMNTPEDVMELAVTYTRIIFAGVPFMFGFNLIMAVLRGSGDAKTPFYFLLLSAVLDIILNPLLIEGMGPFPKMGIAGSAVATFIAQLISFVLLLLYLYGKKYFLRITLSDLHMLRVNWMIVKALIAKGLPMGLNMVVVSLSNLLLIHLVNSFGSEASAAFGIANQISSYVQMPAMAIGGAVTSMAAQNIGAGNWSRVHRITWTGVGFNIVLTGLLVVLIHLFNRQALGLFLPAEGKAIDIGIHINNVTLWSFILFGIFNVVAGVVRSAGAVMMPLIYTFIALLILRIPLSYWLGYEYGLDAIWWSFPASFLLGAILNVWYYRFGKWKEARMLADKKAEMSKG
ncbi:putative efflux protein, MATE family [Paenibacillus sp. UNCCL117]|uniref:MATE family efflux transporter n=1 Tax=unclassified Paenibacillus TaxID=185978 RepID=UPI0008891471|nr:MULTISPECIES: MATE family efflux transporter [unclassified Paenibacillus]SDC51491.1 putative efflux protein, MATE family [Paenibacillus sp. cl123]SFW11449.1 putative efflux protein, MATE family [Paenibacillus sp. UNCCL117]